MLNVYPCLAQWIARDYFILAGSRYVVSSCILTGIRQLVI
jgi:hypothetical protein